MAQAINNKFIYCKPDRWFYFCLKLAHHYVNKNNNLEEIKRKKSGILIWTQLVNRTWLTLWVNSLDTQVHKLNSACQSVYHLITIANSRNHSKVEINSFVWSSSNIVLFCSQWFIDWRLWYHTQGPLRGKFWRILTAL